MNLWLCFIAMALYWVFPAHVYAEHIVHDTPYCSDDPPTGIDRNMYIWLNQPNNGHYQGWNGRGWEGRGKQRKGHLYYCHGDMPGTEPVIYVWEAWENYIPKEDWFYPLQVVDTVKGVLVVRGRELTHTVWLDAQPLVEHLASSRIHQVYPEEASKPEIVIVSMSAYSTDSYKSSEFPDPSPSYGAFEYRFIDFGVDPIYIHKAGLPLGWRMNDKPDKEEKDWRIPHGTDITIKKINDSTYIFSGRRIEADEDGKHPRETYKYDRKTRSLIKLEPETNKD